MSTFQKAPQSVHDLALGLMTQYESHKALCDGKVKIDLVLAFGDTDPETGERKSYAIMERGIRILGRAKAITLKDRAKGMGDAEIILDGDHWNEIGDAEKAALLDHELQHITPKLDERGFVRDDLGRCKIKMRKHDVEVGWFSVISARHKSASIERIQAKRISDAYGQYFWPEIHGEPVSEDVSPLAGSIITMKTVGKEVTFTGEQLAAAAKLITGK